MSEKEFNTLFRLYPYGGSIGYALRELLLYRDLGTLQQLSYATDAVAELRTVKEERDKFREALYEIDTAFESSYGELQDIARLALEEKP